MPYVSSEYMSNLVRGKSVALVGPSQASSSIIQGKKIDSYDFVARVKNFYISEDDKQFFGSRTDFCYTMLSLDDILPGDSVTDVGTKRTITPSKESAQLRNDILLNEIKIIISPYPKSEWFFNRFQNSLENLSKSSRVRILPDEPYFTIKKKTNRPNSGFSAILDLASLPFSEIYITGIDFYRSMYRPGYVNSLWDPSVINHVATSYDGPDVHDPDAQFKYFKYEMYRVDDRIKVDPVLEEFLKDKKYESYKKALGLEK